MSSYLYTPLMSIAAQLCDTMNQDRELAQTRPRELHSLWLIERSWNWSIVFSTLTAPLPLTFSIRLITANRIEIKDIIRDLVHHQFPPSYPFFSSSIIVYFGSILQTLHSKLNINNVVWDCTLNGRCSLWTLQIELHHWARVLNYNGMETDGMVGERSLQTVRELETKGSWTHSVLIEGSFDCTVSANWITVLCTESSTSNDFSFKKTFS